MSKLYDLHRRLENIASALDQRRRNGWVPSKPYIAKLYEIATELKILDKKGLKSR